MMKINNPLELSNFLKHQRKENKRSQVDVAAKIGIQQQTISSFERNSTQAKIDTLFRILNELDLEFQLNDKSSVDRSKTEWTEEW